MKRIISLAVIFAMMLTLVSVPVFAASKFNFIVTETFNNLPTNAGPENTSKVKGQIRTVVVKEGKEKAIELSGMEQTSSVTYSAQSDEPVVSIYSEIKFGKTYPRITISAIDASEGNFTLLDMTSDGKMRTCDSRIATGFSRGKFTPIQIAYDKTSKRVTVYLNGKLIVDNRFASKQAPKTLSAFEIKCMATEDTSMQIDNVAVFEGREKFNTSYLTKSSYNPEEVDATVEEAPVGDTVFLSRTFDEPDMGLMDGFGDWFNGNKVTLETDATGNKYMKIDKKNNLRCMAYLSGPGETKRFVVEGDVSTATTCTRGMLVYGRNEHGAQMFQEYLTNNSGSITIGWGGPEVGRIEKGKWTNFACAFNFDTQTYDVYINHELVAKDVEIVQKDHHEIGGVLFGYQEGTTAEATLLIDNYRIYEGKEPRVIEGAVKKSVLPPDNVGAVRLGTTKAIALTGDAIYNGGEKFQAQSPIVRENNKIYLSEADMKHLFGESVNCAGAHPSKEGYFDVDKTAESIGYKGMLDEGRTKFYATGKIDFSEDDKVEINRYLVYDRPLQSKLQEDYIKTNTGHPRLLLTSSDVERIKSEIQTDSRMKDWYDKTLAYANNCFGIANPVIRLSGSEYLGVSESMIIMPSVCMAYLLTGNKRYAARAWNLAKYLCDLTDWNPEGYLDVGEIGFMVGLCYDWCYDALNETQRKYLAETTYLRSVDRTKRIYYSQTRPSDGYTTWIYAENNWNSVCNGGAMLAAMAIYDEYPEPASDLIACASRALEHMMVKYYPDGDWEEGPTYWWYSSEYVAFFIQSLMNSFGDDYGFLDTPGLDKTGWYGFNFNGSMGGYLLGDTAGEFTDTCVAMWFGKVYKDGDLQASRIYDMEHLQGNVNGLTSEMSPYNWYALAFYDSSLAGNAKAEIDSKSGRMGVYAFRERLYDRYATYLGLNAGLWGTASHRHADVGNFEVHFEGDRILSDCGAENYQSDGYFAGKRYSYYRARPEGHNIYIIDPTNESADDYGQDRMQSAKEIKYVSKEKGGFVISDFSDMYAKYATSAKRGYMLTDDRRTVIIRDEINLKGTSTLYWFLHSQGDFDIIDNNTVILTTSKGVKAKLQFITDANSITFSTGDIAGLPTAPNVVNSSAAGKKQLMATIKHTGNLNITCKITSYGYPEADTPCPNIPLSDWSIPDGSLSTFIPEATCLYLDGKPISTFDPKVSSYKMSYPSARTDIPKLTVDTNLRYDIYNATEFGQDSYVRVYSDTDPSMYRTYRVTLNKKAPLSNIMGLTRFDVIDVQASEVPQVENPPENVFDQDLNTRWSAESINKSPQWLTLTLDKAHTVTKIGVAFMNGAKRQADYLLEVSEDGVNWTEIYKGYSGGNTEDLEFKDVPNLKVKYARITCFGTTESGWNSVTEFAVLGSD